MPRGERTILAKSPGLHLIYKEEFDKAEVGQIGVFFVGWDKDLPNLIVKYKVIPKVQWEQKKEKIAEAQP